MAAALGGLGARNELTVRLNTKRLLNSLKNWNCRLRAKIVNPKFPYSLLLLDKSVNNLKNIIIEKKAITDESGVATLEIFEASGSNRLNSNCENGISVDCISLDDYFLDNHKKISFIKIDVEGLEPRVLKGMKNILKESIKLKILFEYNPKLLKFFGYIPEKILEDLTKQGFSFFDLERDHNEEQNVEHFVKLYNNTQKLTNILAKRG